MSFGKKESKNNGKIKINAPPPITQYEFNSPTGDVFKSRTEGGRQISEAHLSPLTRQMANRSQQNLLGLSAEFGKSDRERAADIRARAQDLFDMQARGINEDADDIMSKARSNLSRRFGGSHAATFGTDLMSRLEKDRLAELSDARRQAGLLGEDLFNSDEDSRMRRFNVFLGYLNTLHNQAAGADNTGANLLLNENQRATDVAIARARLLDSARNRNTARANQRMSLISNALPYGGAAVGGLIGLAAGNPVLGVQLGGTAGAYGARSI